MGTALLVLTLVSHHFRYAHQMHEVNPGVGMEMPILGPNGRPGPYHVAVGGYNNSQADLSFYGLVGRGWRFGGVDVGVVSGYPQAPVLPLIIPYGRAPLGSLGALKVSLLPVSQPIFGVQWVVRVGH